MVEPGHSKLSILQQCILLGISKSSFYYRPVGESEFNLTIMRIMDETHKEYPFYGVERMEAEWCAEIAEEAFRLHGRPEIFNTDQGSQFTSEVFTKTLIGEDTDNPKLKISMDGRERATDDIYIERFWRSIKYENIYLNAYETGVDLYEGVNNYINFYNYSRPHKSIGYQTPECFYQKAS